MEIGIYTFGETTADPLTGKVISYEQRMKDMLEEAELADQLGLEVYGVGEHHRRDFSVSAPAVVLAAIAQCTKNIRLTSAVTVLSSDDPVRVFQDFATVDLLSGGRAEIMAGRGSFIESFPLFGYDLDDYDELFEEKLELLLKLRESESITWSGKYRPSINHQSVYPRPVQNPLPVWIAVGGTPQSVIRAGKLGLPMALAIIGGMPDRFVPLIDLYRETAARAGHESSVARVSINSHTFLSENSQQAADDYYPSYADAMTRIGRERGWSGMTRSQFDLMREPEGSLLVGSPQQVIDKILYEHELFGHDRFLAQLTVGSIPHQKVMHAIELLGNVVAPAVRKATAPARVNS
ncbi:MAG: LLM class flavin-dependent oxidoreductase [Chitinophagales bacterium]|nr:LLM class flavin-dependent oxidoreductase [Chitinophagales bacterium]